MSDAQWAAIEPVLPAAASVRGRGRPEAHARRVVLDAVFYLVAEGVRWRGLPKDFPPWQTVYGFFTRWRDDGTWQRIHDALRDQVRLLEGRDPLPTAAIIDSQSVKAADTVGATRRGYDAGKKINGVKRHVAVDTLGLLLVVMVSPASVQDRDGAVRLLAVLRERFSTIAMVWADGGYAGRLLTWALQAAPLTVTIVKRSDDTSGFAVLPRRPAPPLGRRTHAGLAYRQPTPGPRLRTPHRHPRNHDHHRHDRTDVTAPRPRCLTSKTGS